MILKQEEAVNFSALACLSWVGTLHLVYDDTKAGTDCNVQFLGWPLLVRDLVFGILFFLLFVEEFTIFNEL